ncbi:MAG: hypothetical protein ACOX78_07195 [Lachnospiraceae bacterium]
MQPDKNKGTQGPPRGGPFYINCPDGGAVSPAPGLWHQQNSKFMPSFADMPDFLSASSAIFGQTGIIADFIGKLVLTNSAIAALPIHSADSHAIFKVFSSIKLKYTDAFADILNSQIGKSANQKVDVIIADSIQFSAGPISNRAS